MEQKSGYKYYDDEPLVYSRTKASTFMPVKVGDLNVTVKENPSYDKQKKEAYKLDYVPQPSSANRETTNPLEIDGFYKSHFNLGEHTGQLYVKEQSADFATLLKMLASGESIGNNIESRPAYYKEVKEMRSQALLSRLQPRDI